MREELEAMQVIPKERTQAQEKIKSPKSGGNVCGTPLVYQTQKMIKSLYNM